MFEKEKGACNSFRVDDARWVLDGWLPVADGGRWHVVIDGEGNESGEVAAVWMPSTSRHREAELVRFAIEATSDGGANVVEFVPRGGSGLPAWSEERAVGRFPSLRAAMLHLVPLDAAQVTTADALADLAGVQ